MTPLSMITCEMTKGSCIDIISDNAAGWNWRKISEFGEYSYHRQLTSFDHRSWLLGDLFQTQLKKAVDSSKKH